MEEGEVGLEVYTILNKKDGIWTNEELRLLAAEFGEPVYLSSNDLTKVILIGLHIKKDVLGTIWDGSTFNVSHGGRDDLPFDI